MKKILIWGTGNIARQVLDNQISGEIIGFIETHKSAEVFRGRRVYTLDEIPKEYDFILVASSFVNEIYRLCLTKNVLMEKVIFLKGMKKQEGYAATTSRLSPLPPVLKIPPMVPQILLPLD